MNTHMALEHPFAIAGDTSGLLILERVLASLRMPEGDIVTRRPQAANLAGGLPGVYSLFADSADARAEVNGRELHRGGLGSVMSHLMTAINRSAIESVGRYPVVHAAVVAADGLAILIPGHPGAGKSTLCAALVAHGFGYVSDETAPITPDGLVLPYPKPIVVGAGSFDVLAELKAADTVGMNLDTWFLDPGRLAGGWSRGLSRLGYVVMSQFADGDDVRYAALSPGETAALLASNMFNIQRHRRMALELVAGLALTVPGVKIAHGNVHDAVATIVGLVTT